MTTAVRAASSATTKATTDFPATYEPNPPADGNTVCRGILFIGKRLSQTVQPGFHISDTSYVTPYLLSCFPSFHRQLHSPPHALPPSRRTDREQAYRYRLSATSIFPLGNNFTLQAGKMLSLLLMKSSGNRRNSPLYFKQALSVFQLTPDCRSSKAYLHVR